MNKEIIYGGYTTTPSDYECPDGDLALSVDMLQEDGALKPVVAPTVKLQLADGQRILFIHDTADYKHYIILQSPNLLWLDTSATSVDSATQFYTDAAKINAIEAVGNTLIVNIEDSGLHYFLWKNDSSNNGGAYKYIGQCPPDIGLEFALTMDSSDDYLKTEVKAVLDITRCGDGVPDDSEMTKNEYVFETYQATQDAVMGDFNELISDCKKNTQFLSPFYVRYAYRLYDGSFLKTTAPILMLTEKGCNPFAYMRREIDWNIWNFIYQLYYIPCSLQYIARNGVNSLSNWSDIIKGICIFVSPQIVPYAVTGSKLDHEAVDEDNNQRHFQGGIWGNTKPSNSTRHLSMYNVGADVKKYETSGTAQAYFYGCAYQREDSYSLAEDSYSYYLIKELKISDISASWNKIKNVNLNNLTSFEQLTDAFEPRTIREAKIMHAYNARLNLAYYKVRELPTFPIGDFSCYSANTDDNGHTLKVTFYIEESGQCQLAQAETPTAEDWTGNLGNLPGFIYYPNANAKYAKIETYTDGELRNTYWARLTQHPHLNGAYYYDPFFATLLASGSTKPSEISSWLEVKAFDRNNYISTSDVNNPFSFPATGVNAVGTGMIMGISTAAKALSQGQFGQFPLYAFCTDGVWALEVSDTGVYSAKQPITRDVCVCAESITQMDSAVLFATNRGIMLIEGSQSTCISDTLADYGDTDIFKALPQMSTLLTLANYDNADLTVADFFEFVKTCRMVYDYTHQRIIVYSPASAATRNLAYVYSLKSKKWGLMAVSVAYTLNSYPDALAVSGSNEIVDFSADGDSGEYGNGLLVTRPIKLDPPDALKTVQSVIQRGFFRKGSVQCVLYGSRDLVNWFAVFSSKDQYLRGFSGTPYKYFRLALVTSLLPSESVSGCSVLYHPQFTNKPR